MTIEEASEKYCIPIKILKEYESMELCGDSCEAGEHRDL